MSSFMGWSIWDDNSGRQSCSWFARRYGVRVCANTEDELKEVIRLKTIDDENWRKERQ